MEIPIDLPLIEDINKIYRCVESVGGNFNLYGVGEMPKDRSHLFDFCEEQSQNTCCMLRDVDKIAGRYNFMKD